jgi:hypothetical protein
MWVELQGADPSTIVMVVVVLDVRAQDDSRRALCSGRMLVTSAGVASDDPYAGLVVWGGG